jgi:hypothetical protein
MVGQPTARNELCRQPDALWAGMSIPIRLCMAAIVGIEGADWT